MARPGPKRRFTDQARSQLADLRERGLSQQQMADLFGVSQQTISRELAKLERQRQSPEDEPADDPIAFVNGFDRGLKCLRGITTHYRRIASQDGAEDWKEASLAAYHVKFRELVEWN
jgi:IS30 family transposase